MDLKKVEKTTLIPAALKYNFAANNQNHNNTMDAFSDSY